MRRVLAAAAEAGLVGAAVTAAEILGRGAAGRPPAFPLQDLGVVATASALVGVVVALLARVMRRRLSSAGVALGLAGGLYLWLPTVTGGTLLSGSHLAKSVFYGGATVLAAAILGHLMFKLLGRGRRFERPALVDAVVLVLIAISALAPWAARTGALGSDGGPKAGAPSSPNVLLLTIDTLRSDRLGAAGEPSPTSPHMDRLARRGIQFSNASTPQPRTLPALASLATGSYPHTHGVRDNFHYTLGDASTTLAERLQGAGYTTAAVNSNPVLSHDSGIYQGFDSANDRGDDWARTTLVRGVRRLATLVAMRALDRDAVVTSLALDWLRLRPREKPYFLWVHYLAPHVPYEPAAPFDVLFDPAYEGEYAKLFDYGDVSKGEMTYRNRLDPRTLEHVKHLYDGEVATSDRAIGALLHAMDAAGDLENTRIVLTADHGESLDEHGYFFNHGDFVYGPAMNVPLVVRAGGTTLANDSAAAAGVLRDEPVSLVDLAPTILTFAGVPLEDHAFDGIPLRLSPGTAPTPRPIFGDSDFCRFPALNERLGYLLPAEIAQSPENIPDWKEKWEAQAIQAKQRAVTLGNWKMVLSPHPEGDGVELFDLAADPGERANAAAVHAEIARELEALLRRWRDEGAARPSAAGDRILDEETIAKMRALGYVGN